MTPSPVFRVGTVFRVHDRDWAGVVCLHRAILWKDADGVPVAGCGKCFRAAKKLREAQRAEEGR
jgi:hypothetical protein